MTPIRRNLALIQRSLEYEDQSWSNYVTQLFKQSCRYLVGSRGLMYNILSPRSSDSWDSHIFCILVLVFYKCFTICTKHLIKLFWKAVAVRGVGPYRYMSISVHRGRPLRYMSTLVQWWSISVYVDFARSTTLIHHVVLFRYIEWSIQACSITNITGLTNLTMNVAMNTLKPTHVYLQCTYSRP